jgi:hypothetical protein
VAGVKSLLHGELPITEKLPERLRWTQLSNIANETGVLLNCKLMKKLNAVKTLLTLSLEICLFQTAIADKNPSVWMTQAWWRFCVSLENEFPRYDFQVEKKYGVDDARTSNRSVRLLVQ